MSARPVVAVDLGASSGRVMLAEVGPDRLALTETHRFSNDPVRVLDTLHWDVLALYQGVLRGLREAGRLGGQPASIGIDSWAVDYGLLDPAGALLGNPVHYRDTRTDGVAERVLTEVSATELYATTGVQLLPFNTVFQLVAAEGSSALTAAARLLLVPDLLSYWLTGVAGTEATNASTTQLVDVRTGRWAVDLMKRVGIRPDLFGDLRDPGRPAGQLRGSVLTDTGLTGPIPVTAVGSHDTASAVVAVPAENDRFGYISCGTWSLVGLELPEPVLSEDSRTANFTNERGVDGTIRYLRNVMGLWLLQESLRTWREAGREIDLPALIDQAGRLPARRSVIDPDLPVFLPPGDMPARIAAECRRTGQPVPVSPAELVRCVLDSLALAYRRTVATACRLADREVDVLHLVGGGARNELLCQLTADACGVPVVAGPVEATALGNALVQARAVGAVGGGLAELRALVRGTQDLRRYEPAGDTLAWLRAGEALAG
ncbi:MAG TPA: rhamnulokinase family protein [Pseudonocardiaceae bacterium]|jgi:rhamnulokinase|nr:rhamnulokinase family protein [Pseudonocardiaceae bacterium]